MTKYECPPWEGRPSFRVDEIKAALSAHLDTRVYVNGEPIVGIDADRPSAIEITTDGSNTVPLDAVLRLIEDINQATRAVGVRNVLARFCEAEGIEP
jgi:hypothetical protein